MKEVKVTKETIQITLNKLEGQTAIFIIVGTISIFFEIPYYCFLWLGLCWLGLIQILKSELKNKEK